MPVQIHWNESLGQYRGDGKPPAGREPVTRGEAGVYLAKDDDELLGAVNAAIAVSQPLLVTGEPGTGKTTLAWSIASELGLGDVLEFHTRSDNRARDVFYSYNHLLRFYHAQQGDPQAAQPEKYVELGTLGLAFKDERRRVVLIDEIDKAPRDFPNDMLDQIDHMYFDVEETRQRVPCKHRPVVVITSNSERQLPDAFLRRCVFHHIQFPTDPEKLKARLRSIVELRLGGVAVAPLLIQAAVDRLVAIVADQKLELDRTPAVAELIVWVRTLHLAGIDGAQLMTTRLAELPFRGLLTKTRADAEKLERAGR